MNDNHLIKNRTFYTSQHFKVNLINLAILFFVEKTKAFIIKAWNVFVFIFQNENFK